MRDWRDDPTERDWERNNDRAADDSLRRTYDDIARRSFEIADLDRKIERMKRSQERTETFDSALALKSRLYDEIDAAKHIPDHYKSEWRGDLVPILLTEKAASDQIGKLLAKVEAYRQPKDPVPNVDLDSVIGTLEKPPHPPFNFNSIAEPQVPDWLAEPKPTRLGPLALSPKLTDNWLLRFQGEQERRKAEESKAEIEGIISQLRKLQELHSRYIYLAAS